MYVYISAAIRQVFKNYLSLLWTEVNLPWSTAYEVRQAPFALWYAHWHDNGREPFVLWTTDMTINGPQLLYWLLWCADINTAAVIRTVRWGNTLFVEGSLKGDTLDVPAGSRIQVVCPFAVLRWLFLKAAVTKILRSRSRLHVPFFYIAVYFYTTSILLV